MSAIATLASAALETARDVERLRTENQLLRERLDAGCAGIVGESIAIDNASLSVITLSAIKVK